MFFGKQLFSKKLIGKQHFGNMFFGNMLFGKILAPLAHYFGPKGFTECKNVKRVCFFGLVIHNPFLRQGSDKFTLVLGAG